MRHTLKIKIGKKIKNEGIVTIRQNTVRERLLRFLLGSPIKLTVIVPGDSVEEIGIKEISERSEKYGRD